MTVILASGTTVEVTDRITVRIPESTRDPHEFLIGEEGNLEDAGQQTTIGFRVVGACRVLRENGDVDSATGVIAD